MSNTGLQVQASGGVQSSVHTEGDSGNGLLSAEGLGAYVGVTVAVSTAGCRSPSLAGKRSVEAVHLLLLMLILLQEGSSSWSVWTRLMALFW